MSSSNKRWALLAGAVLVLAAAGGGYAYLNRGGDKPAEAAKAAAPGAAAPHQPASGGGKVEIRADDMVLGKPDAPVTIVEYASMTCPHCAAFHAAVVPALKKDYVETGKVRFIFREFPFDEAAFNASVLARCAGPDRFFGFLDLLFQRQRDWASDKDSAAKLAELGKLGGVAPDAFKACLADKALTDSILNRRLEGAQVHGVNATPTLLINGEKATSIASVEDLKKLLDPLVGPKS